MRNFLILIVLLVIVSAISAEYSLTITPKKKIFAPGEVVELAADFKLSKGDSELWDTYLFFMDSHKIPRYIIVVRNTLKPTPLGMLPKKIKLLPVHWYRSDRVRLFLCICKPNTQKMLAITSTSIIIQGRPDKKRPQLPESCQLRLIQALETKSNTRSSRSYTDYKQFDSRWKNELLNNGPKTIGQIGCAMSAAGNIISWTPSNLNTYLKNNGGYSGNLIIWSKVPGISYKGSGSISASLFNSYHVIGYVGGHFVLLTSQASPGHYYSHDPGKSSNPIYSSGQIYSVKLYYK